MRYVMMSIRDCCVLTLILLMSPVTGPSHAEEVTPRCEMWVDAYLGESVGYKQVLDDLAGVRVVYIGERHRLDRHHEIQEKIIDDLAQKGMRLVLGLEQMEALQQPMLDRYSQGEIDFQQLAEVTEWAKRWGNYQDYRAILETAREHGIPILALNARSEVVRQVARGGGVDKLSPEMRKQLPTDLRLEDPVYGKLLDWQLMVHMTATTERLRPIREAQICRDEMMADVLTQYLRSKKGKGRTAIVLAGVGHVSFGLGTVSRVKRRIPGIKDRVLLLSESGDLELTAAEKAMARPIEITHEQLKSLGRPLADYFHIRSAKSRGPKE